MAPPAAAAAPPPGGGGAANLPIEGKTVKALTMLSLKRTHDLFVGSHGQKVPLDEEGQRVKLACKVRCRCLRRSAARPRLTCFRCLHPLGAQMRDEYSALQGYKSREVAAAGARAAAASSGAGAAADSKSHTAKLIDSIPAQP